MFGTLANRKYDEIPAGIETNCGKRNLIGDDDEIPRWNRDYFWDHK